MKKGLWENGATLILGIWLFTSPWIITNELASSTTLMLANWNAWITGALIGGVAVLAMRNLRPWEEWTNVALGAWLILSPWILGYSGELGLLWNSLAVGFLVTLLSGMALPVAARPGLQR